MKNLGHFLESDSMDAVRITAETSRLEKSWQNVLFPFRDVLVTKIVKLILPTVTNIALNDNRYVTLIKFIKKSEKQTFDESNDQVIKNRTGSEDFQSNFIFKRLFLLVSVL